MVLQTHKIISVITGNNVWQIYTFFLRNSNLLIAKTGFLFLVLVKLCKFAVVKTESNFLKKICFVTGTRADYGIMAPVMREIEASSEAELQIVATNMHLSPCYGMTVNEIEADGFRVDARVASLDEGGDTKAAVRSMSRTMEGLAEAFELLKPDVVVVLGDRYEALSAAAAAVTFNIPVAHLHGGETTEGAIDNKFRHAITQLASMHFASTPQYKEKIVTMGADPATVFHSGAPGAEIKETSTEMPELFAVDFLKAGEPFILFAFHSVTLLPDKGLSELKATLEALDNFISEGYKVLLTMPNSDPGTKEITATLKEWAGTHPGVVKAVASLGSKLFHEAMEHASVMVGNSSAALIEAPSHRLGAVNVGVRQKGRAHGPTVLDTPAQKERIISALQAALSLEMKSVLLGLPVSALNPYYKEASASFIASTLLEASHNPDQLSQL